MLIVATVYEVFTNVATQVDFQQLIHHVPISTAVIDTHLGSLDLLTGRLWWAELADGEDAGGSWWREGLVNLAS